MKTRKPKLRPMGDILLDMEPLYRELMLGHKLQRSDLWGIILQYDQTHGLEEDVIETYTDGTKAVTYHGHKSGLK
jgi:hypothetical protein